MSRFEMNIDESFDVPHRGGVVVTGKAAWGEIRAGDRLWLQSGERVLPVRVKFLEAFHNVGPKVRYAGDVVAAGLEGVRKSEILPGARLIGNG